MEINLLWTIHHGNKLTPTQRHTCINTIGIIIYFLGGTLKIPLLSSRTDKDPPEEYKLKNDRGVVVVEYAKGCVYFFIFYFYALKSDRGVAGAEYADGCVLIVCCFDSVDIHTCTHKHISYVYIVCCIDSVDIHSCTYTHAHTHMHIHTCTYTHAHTHMHIHTCTYIVCWFDCFDIHTCVYFSHTLTRSVSLSLSCSLSLSLCLSVSMSPSLSLSRSLAFLLSLSLSRVCIWVH